MGARDELTERIRALVGLDPRVTEQPMFGGVCFLLDGRIPCRRAPHRHADAAGGRRAGGGRRRPAGVAHMLMRGRPAANFIEVEADFVEGEDELGRFIALAERYVSALGPKI